LPNEQQQEGCARQGKIGCVDDAIDLGRAMERGQKQVDHRGVDRGLCGRAAGFSKTAWRQRPGKIDGRKMPIRQMPPSEPFGQ
jgi:hypothetical protein